MNYVLDYLAFAVIGYLSGSVLYAKLWGYAFAKKDITENTVDSNPGTFNAFANGGFLCGSLTVICDLAKGIIPVALCLHLVDAYAHNEYLMALCLVAPIIGHIFPVFFKFKGGKGIAVTFGVLLGFVPDIRNALLMAIVYIIFAAVIVVKPNIYGTMISVIVSALISPFVGYRLAVVIAYFTAALIICLRLAFSKEEREHLSVALFFKWKLISRDIDIEVSKEDDKEIITEDSASDNPVEGRKEEGIIS